MNLAQRLAQLERQTANKPSTPELHKNLAEMIKHSGCGLTTTELDGGQNLSPVELVLKAYGLSKE